MLTYSDLRPQLNTETARDILDNALEVGALLLHGEFTLASGKKSDHYFEGKKVTLSPKGAYLVGKAVFDELVGTQVDAVGGLSIGADFIATAVALYSYLQGKPIPGFIVREVPKEHGTRRKIEGHLKEGSRVAIVDDVITTGGSIIKAIEAVEAVGCRVVKVIAIVDRQEGGSDRLKEKGYDLTSIISLPPSGEVTIAESAAVKE